MTVKSTVSFTDRHHAFAKRKVEEGSMPSVSSLVAMGLENLMQEEEERAHALEAMKDVIRQRMETPREEWVVHKPGEYVARLRQKLEQAQ